MSAADRLDVTTCACGCGGRPSKWGAEYIRGHRPPTPAVDRFWPKVQKTNGCWVWIGAIGSHGYGSFWLGGDEWVLAHRFAYEQTNGPIPDGHELDHLCRNRRCCNPTHLEPVTGAENLRRMREHRPLVTHCRHGHAYDEGNTFINAAGYRECRTCLQARRSGR